MTASSTQILRDGHRPCKCSTDLGADLVSGLELSGFVLCLLDDDADGGVVQVEVVGYLAHRAAEFEVDAGDLYVSRGKNQELRIKAQTTGPAK